MKKLLAGAVALLMSFSVALAEGKSYEGTVVSTQTQAVLATAAGVIGAVNVQAGEQVSAGDEVAALQETTVYAEQDGRVTVFGGEGESVETITDRYGAVVYLEPIRQLTLTGNTSYAYDAVENRIVHPGEVVYLKTTSTTTRSGKGLVTAVNGTKFTVEVMTGDLKDDDIVYIYRSEDYETKSRIGRGTVGYTGEIAVTGAGVVSSILVKDDQLVQAGTPLFTTVDAPAYAWQMTAPADGVISSMNVAPGDTVEAGTLIAEIYPDSAMRLEIIVESRDLRSIHVGDKATISFDNGVTAEGEIERISNLPYVSDSTEEDDDTVWFAVYAVFTSAETIPYGMTAKVVVGE